MPPLVPQENDLRHCSRTRNWIGRAARRIIDSLTRCSGDCLLAVRPCLHRSIVACLVVLPALGEPTFAAAGDDAVNERPPVTRAQRETHWGVDCAGLRQELLHGGRSAATASELARWRDALTLCAAIHNTPGTPDAASCPDYAGARRVIADAHGDAGAGLMARLRSSLACER